MAIKVTATKVTTRVTTKVMTTPRSRGTAKTKALTNNRKMMTLALTIFTVPPRSQRQLENQWLRMMAGVTTTLSIQARAPRRQHSKLLRLMTVGHIMIMSRVESPLNLNSSINSSIIRITIRQATIKGMTSTTKINITIKIKATTVRPTQVMISSTTMVINRTTSTLSSRTTSKNTRNRLPRPPIKMTMTSTCRTSTARKRRLSRSNKHTSQVTMLSNNIRRLSRPTRSQLNLPINSSSTSRATRRLQRDPNRRLTSTWLMLWVTTQPTKLHKIWRWRMQRKEHSIARLTTLRRATRATSTLIRKLMNLASTRNKCMRR